MRSVSIKSYAFVRTALRMTENFGRAVITPGKTKIHKILRVLREQC